MKSIVSYNIIKLLLPITAVCIFLFSCSSKKQYDPYNGLTEVKVKDSVRAVVQKMYNDVLGTVASVSINIISLRPVSEKTINEFLYKKKLKMVNEAVIRLDSFVIKYPDFDSTLILNDKMLINKEKSSVDSIHRKITSSDTAAGRYYEYIFTNTMTSKITSEEPFSVTDTAFISSSFDVSKQKSELQENFEAALRNGKQ